MTRAKAFMKGEWKSLWNKCRSQGVARQGKLAQAPQTATTRTYKQVDVAEQKYARAGKLSKTNQKNFSTLKAALKPDTLDKLNTKNPQDSTDFDFRHWPTAEEMDERRWMLCAVMTTGRTLKPNRFSVKKIRQYFARCAPLSAQDVDGWRSREHIRWTRMLNDEMFHDLICTLLILPYVKGDFNEGHLSEAAGGKFFALEKPNVANFLMSTYDNFKQFALPKRWRHSLRSNHSAHCHVLEST